MERLLSLDDLSDRTGQPVRRLREWCATGKLVCEVEGSTWRVPESELRRVAQLAEERDRAAAERRAVALAIPAPIVTFDLAAEVASRLQLPPKAVAVSSLAIDGHDYVVAVWPHGDGNGLPALAELADELGGELLDGEVR